MSQKLFSELNLRDNVSRNGFSLDHNVKFSAQVGELLPICVLDVMPTDKFKLRVSNFTRTANVQSAAYTQIVEYFDWFFVPARILQKDLPNILAEDTRNPYSAQSAVSSKKIGTKVPQLSLDYLYGTSPIDGIVGRLSQEVNQFGFNRGKKTAKLLSYLGYGNITDAQVDQIANADILNFSQLFNSNYQVSLLPLAAYQAIYYYWFRNTQWEENQPQNYNFDWMTSGNYNWFVDLESNASFWSAPTLFDLQYSNYPKDLFFGVLPDSQMGDDAEVLVTPQATGANGYVPVGLFEPGENSATFQSARLTDDVLTGTSGNSGFGVVPTTGTGTGSADNLLLGVEKSDLRNAYTQLASSFSILELRKQEAIQKYREILGTGENNYKSILEKLFNANVSDKLANIPYYLGGSTSQVKISEVENTNLVDENQVFLKGKGVGSSNGDSIEFESKDEYGFLICIYHAQPRVDYKLNNLSFSVTKTDTDDFAKPIFDSLGMVELPMHHVDISSGLSSAKGQHLGYTIRNYDYKTAVDRSLGAFRTTELQNWYSPIDFDYLADYVSNNGDMWLGINSSFFKVNPHIVDDIFYVAAGDNVDTDQLRVNANFNISAVRPLSRYGVPYAK